MSDPTGKAITPDQATLLARRWVIGAMAMLIVEVMLRCLGITVFEPLPEIAITLMLCRAWWYRGYINGHKQRDLEQQQ